MAKNKVAPPFKQAEFDIMYGEGISWEGTVLDTGLDRKIVQKSGSYFSFGDERLGQGRQNATAFLKEHPDLVQQILQGIQAAMPPGQIVSARLLPQAEPTEATPVERSKPSKPKRRPRPRRRRGRTWLRASRRSSPSRATACASSSTASRGAACPRRRSSGRGSRSGSSSTGRERERSGVSCAASRRSPSRRARWRGATARPPALAARLERRGVAPRTSARARWTTLAAGGLPRRRPLRRLRASALAARGYGDEAIRFDLEREGLAADAIAEALGAVAPEAERAAAIVARSGRSAKTARRLAAKGFAADTVESLFE